MSHVNKLLQETSIQQKALGQKQWLEVAFEFDNPILSTNQYPPPANQLNWGVMVNGQNVPWFITQKSIENALNAIGPKRGTKVRVAKIRTGPQQKEIEYEVEYVSGTMEPRDIRAELEAGQQPQQTTTQAPPPQATPVQAAPSSKGPDQSVYTQMGKSARDLINAVLDDIEQVYWICYDRVKANERTKEWDEERIGSTATGFNITLGNQLRGLQGGGYNARSDYAAFNSFTVEETPVPPPPPGEMTLEQLQQAAVDLLPLDKGLFVSGLFDLLVYAHPHSDNEHQVRAILKNKLGYETLPTQADVLSSLVHEYTVYCTTRDEGKDDVDACTEVHAQCGRDLSLMPPITKTGVEPEDQEEIVL